MRHAGTALTRSATVPDDEPAEGVLPLQAALGRRGRLSSSPAARCRQSCGDLRPELDPLLAPWDLGSWAGRPLEQVDLVAWRGDPAYDGHGGESLHALLDRAGRLLQAQHAEGGTTVAVTHAAVVKAVVVRALGAPAAATWDLDVHPGRVSELHARPGGWRVVQVNAPLPQAQSTPASAGRSAARSAGDVPPG